MKNILKTEKPKLILKYGNTKCVTMNHLWTLMETTHKYCTNESEMHLNLILHYDANIFEEWEFGYYTADNTGLLVQKEAQCHKLVFVFTGGVKKILYILIKLVRCRHEIVVAPNLCSIKSDVNTVWNKETNKKFERNHTSTNVLKVLKAIAP